MFLGTSQKSPSIPGWRLIVFCFDCHEICVDLAWWRANTKPKKTEEAAESFHKKDQTDTDSIWFISLHPLVSFKKPIDSIDPQNCISAFPFPVISIWFSLDRYDMILIELDDGKIYRKPLYLMVKTMVSCRFSLKPIHWDTNSPRVATFRGALATAGDRDRGLLSRLAPGHRIEVCFTG